MRILFDRSQCPHKIDRPFGVLVRPKTEIEINWKRNSTMGATFTKFLMKF